MSCVWSDLNKGHEGRKHLLGREHRHSEGADVRRQLGGAGKAHALAHGGFHEEALGGHAAHRRVVVVDLAASGHLASACVWAEAGVQ